MEPSEAVDETMEPPEADDKTMGLQKVAVSCTVGAIRKRKQRATKRALEEASRTVFVECFSTHRKSNHPQRVVHQDRKPGKAPPIQLLDVQDGGGDAYQGYLRPLSYLTADRPPSFKDLAETLYARERDLSLYTYNLKVKEQQKTEKRTEVNAENYQRRIQASSIKRLKTTADEAPGMETTEIDDIQNTAVEGASSEKEEPTAGKTSGKKKKERSPEAESERLPKAAKTKHKTPPEGENLRSPKAAKTKNKRPPETNKGRPPKAAKTKHETPPDDATDDFADLRNKLREMSAVALQEKCKRCNIDYNNNITKKDNTERKDNNDPQKAYRGDPHRGDPHQGLNKRDPCDPSGHSEFTCGKPVVDCKIQAGYVHWWSTRLFRRSFVPWCRGGCVPSGSVDHQDAEACTPAKPLNKQQLVDRLVNHARFESCEKAFKAETLEDQKLEQQTREQQRRDEQRREENKLVYLKSPSVVTWFSITTKAYARKVKAPPAPPETEETPDAAHAIDMDVLPNADESPEHTVPTSTTFEPPAPTSTTSEPPTTPSSSTPEPPALTIKTSEAPTTTSSSTPEPPVPPSTTSKAPATPS
jgi:hypothetical protein